MTTIQKIADIEAEVRHTEGSHTAMSDSRAELDDAGAAVPSDQLSAFATKF
jgi:hypothetical protein